MATRSDCMTETVGTGDKTPPTFEEVFEAAEAASPAVEPETPAPESEKPADATVQPDAEKGEPDDASSPVDAGPIPFERHKAILENTRSKTRAEVEAEWQHYAWAKQVPQETLERAIQFSQTVATKPREFWASLTEELLAHPEHGQALRSELARVLGSTKGRAEKEDPEPQPDLQAEDGRLVYSADQLRKWHQWNDGRARQSFETMLAERLQPYEAERQKQEAREMEQAAVASATETLTEARTWHGFSEHEPAIKQAMVEHADWSLERAYTHVLQTTILPALKGSDQQAVLADLKRKAAASSLNPGQAAPVTPSRPQTFEEAFAWMEKE